MAVEGCGGGDVESLDELERDAGVARDVLFCHGLNSAEGGHRDAFPLHWAERKAHEQVVVYVRLVGVGVRSLGLEVVRDAVGGDVVGEAMGQRGRVHERRGECGWASIVGSFQLVEIVERVGVGAERCRWPSFPWDRAHEWHVHVGGSLEGRSKDAENELGSTCR